MNDILEHLLHQKLFVIRELEGYIERGRTSNMFDEYIERLLKAVLRFLKESYEENNNE